ncbi:MAG TPA: glycosyl hydrolase [Saprospiraceae bacterium]|nr:glycosyl hydrolase [Saprospiraceae bacterium]HMQ85601.1 glycosyl hydrolase [Saprospiraceae bacterium]
MKKHLLLALGLVWLSLLSSLSIHAQTAYDPALFDAVEWRCIGPFRGGRSCAVTGVPGKPNLFYFGSTGGGIWRTKDGGQSWDNISDGFFGGSIGAIAVSDYDNNVIYVGGGEKTVRGNVSFGYGIWKSEDAGKTWKSCGLDKSRHISRIRIHPQNPDLVYAAVMGDLFQSSKERGIYRSKDGGKTWDQILFANEDAGAVDLMMAPDNPRILYASTWRVRRTPYSLESGGEGSDLWRSTDGGNNWEKLSGKKGLPKGPFGIIGLTVSGANSERVWAIIEAAEGGVFRSDDGGETWTKTNDDRALRQRAWYYSRIYADPKDADVVYVVNVQYHKSTDGGKTFKAFNAPHGDHHDLWIAPEDPERLIIGDDGGAQISFDGGENWSTYHNQPTAQFYRLTTDNHFPYRIYAAQQDNSTVRILHRTDHGSISERDWEETAGGESAHIAVDPTNNDIVYGGSYGGYLTRINHATKEEQAINVWPDNPMGHGAEGMKYRFQWNFPIFFSPHQPNKLYAASNHLHVTTDGGQSWETISPDLTRNDPSKLGPSGGSITKDNTGVEYYCTIFAVAESPYEAGLIWTGSDDGLIHVSKDGGANWANVSPPGMPEWMMINSIEPDPFIKGGCYIAGTRYKLGDYRPYIYRTKDYGQSWELLTTGIANEHFTRVVRADPAQQGLLYCGTESGMYYSLDDGKHWHSFQLNLPIVPITDLLIKEGSLIAATQGRSIWMIDDLEPLHQMSAELAKQEVILFQPKSAYRMGGSQNKKAKGVGTNHPGGVPVYFYVKNLPADSISVKLSFHLADGTEIRSFSNKAEKEKDKLALKAGANCFVWNMRHQDATTFEGMVLWWGQTSGPKAVPGNYQVKLSIGQEAWTESFQILKDPRSSATLEDMQAQFDFIQSVNDKVSEAHQAIIDIRTVRKQLQFVGEGWKDDAAKKPLRDQAQLLDSLMTIVETTLYQTKNRSGQDPLNFPIRLTNKLAHLHSLSGMGDFRPTEQAIAVKNELTALIDEQLAQWEEIKTSLIPAFNAAVKAEAVDVIRLE